MNFIKRPAVGVATILVRGEKVLMGKRKGSHGEGMWAFPGGHLEWNEDFVSCAKRELMEETGLNAEELKFFYTTNDFFVAEQKHYVTIFMVGTADGEARVMEDDKCEEWKWFNWFDLPENIFLSIKNLQKQGICPVESDLTIIERKTIQITKEFIREKMHDLEPGHNWYHIERVVNLAKRIGKSEGADMFILELSALLHEMSDYKFNDGNTNKGMEVIQELLLGLNVDSKIIDKIIFIADNVSYKGAGVRDIKLSLEGRIVQDADRLDAMGAIGIARAFSYGSWKKTPFYVPGSEPVLNSDFEEYKRMSSSTINHFYEKLLLLKDRLHTDLGKSLGEERHRFLETYLEHFFEELEEDDSYLNEKDDIGKNVILSTGEIISDSFHILEQKNKVENHTIQSYNMHAGEYDEYYGRRFAEYVSHLADEFISYLSGNKIADFGSGSGNHSAYFVARGIDSLCVDLSDKMLEKCVEKGLKIHKADILEKNFEDKSFDGIWAYNSLVHLKRGDLPAAIDRIWQALKEDGILGISVLEGAGEGFENDKNSSGTKRWFTYLMDAEIRMLFGNKFEIISFFVKKRSDRTNLLHYIMRKK